MTRLQEFKREYHKWLYIEQDWYIDVLFGVIFANRLNSKPVWLFLIGPSGCGKSELVRAWDGHPSIYAADRITAHTLASGKIPDPGEPDPSLLPKLHMKILVLQDFAAMLGMNYPDFMEVIGQLRAIYDGTFRAIFGTGKETRYTGKFGLIAACTADIYRHTRLLSLLGERFLYFRMPEVSEEERDKRAQVAAMCHATSVQEAEIKRAAHYVLGLRTGQIGPKVPEIARKIFLDLARLVAVSRTVILREERTKEVIDKADPEIHTRLVKQFVTLSMGIGMAREEQEIEGKTVAMVREVALGTIPPNRLMLMRLMRGWEGKVVRPTAGVLAKQSRINVSTIRRWLADLYLLGLADRERLGNNPQSSFVWTLPQKVVDLL